MRITLQVKIDYDNIKNNNRYQLSKLFPIFYKYVYCVFLTYIYKKLLFYIFIDEHLLLFKIYKYF